MQFEKGFIYHVYNVSYQNQQVFFNSESYLLFLRKIREYVRPTCDILSWCLLPDQFHFLIYANDLTIRTIQHKTQQTNAFTEGLKTCLSQYAQHINRQKHTSGTLFKETTKSKPVFENNSIRYAQTCFHYLHQLPCKLHLAEKMEDWEFSSFREYAGIKKSSLSNQLLTKKILQIELTEFMKLSYKALNEDDINQIW